MTGFWCLGSVITGFSDASLVLPPPAAYQTCCVRKQQTCKPHGNRSYPMIHIRYISHAQLHVTSSKLRHICAMHM